MPLLILLLAFAGLASGESITSLVNPAGAHWDRRDNVVFLGDHRGAPGVTPWMDRMLWQLRNLPPAGLVRAAWAGCENAASLPLTYEQRRPALEWSVAVMMYGAFDAQLEKAPEPAAFAQSLRTAVAALVKDGVVLVMATPMPCGDKKAGNPLDAKLDAYAEAIREIAAGDGITLCDLRREAAAWLAEKNTEDKAEGVLSVQLPDKRWALNEQGHAFAAERMATAIGKAMQAAPLRLADLPTVLIGDTEIVLRSRRVTPGSTVEIRYALDGKDPAGKDGKPYKEPFKLRKAESLVVLLREGGRTTTVSHRFGTAAALRPAERAAAVQPGLKVEGWSGRYDKLPDVSTLGPPTITGICHAPDAAFVTDPDAPAVPDEFYTLRFQGFIEVPRDGYYTFHLGSDDGSRLSIGDDTLVDNDGNHAPAFKSAGIALKEGRHAVTVQYMQANAGRSLQVLYEGPGIRLSPVPDAAWSYDPKAKAPTKR